MTRPVGGPGFIAPMMFGLAGAGVAASGSPVAAEAVSPGVSGRPSPPADADTAPRGGVALAAFAASPAPTVARGGALSASVSTPRLAYAESVFREVSPVLAGAAPYAARLRAAPPPGSDFARDTAPFGLPGAARALPYDLRTLLTADSRVLPAGGADPRPPTVARTAANAGTPPTVIARAAPPDGSPAAPLLLAGLSAAPERLPVPVPSFPLPPALPASPLSPPASARDSLSGTPRPARQIETEPLPPPGKGVDPLAPTDPSAQTMFVLAAIVNDVPTDRVLTVERTPDGDFLVEARDLRALRVILSPGVADDARIALSALPGVSVRYIEQSQSLAISVPGALLTATEIDARRNRQGSAIRPSSPISGFAFNYRLFGSAETGRNAGSQLSGDTELVAMIPQGLIVSEGFFSTQRQREFVRGATFFRHEDIDRVRTYTAGDLITGAVSWSRSVRLGGLQVQSAFRQRPDIYTGPLPDFAGSAALPSSLELFADSVRVFSTQVPQGPFVLRSIPNVSGNELRIVTTDQAGRQTQITTPYFNAPELLRKGLTEYSLEAGAPRTGIGVRSFGYGGRFFTSATLRHGLTDRMTVEGHLESGSGLVNGGVGFVRALGPLGSLNASIAASRFEGRDGAKATGQYRFDRRGFSLFASAEQEFGRYVDLGDVSSFRLRPRDPAAPPAALREQRRSVQRIGVSLRPDFDPISLTASYNRLKFGALRTETANLSLRRRLNSQLTLTGDAVVDLGRRRDVGVTVGVNVRFGRDVSGFAEVERARGRTSYNAAITGFSGGRQNALGYSLAVRGDDDGNGVRSAALNYRFPEVFVAGAIDQAGDDVRGTLQLEGSFIAAQGDVFAANRIGEGFAIVRNAGPGVDILQGGRKVARSNSKGRALLFALEPFSETRVSLDPASLPPGLEPENGTDFAVVTERRRAALIDFGVRRINAALLIVTGRDGQPIPVGARVEVEGGKAAPMGYDGQVYLTDLEQTNRFRIDLGNGKSCSGSFTYDPDGAVQPLIGPVPCL